MASCRNKEDIAEKSRIDPAQTVGRPHSSIEGLAEESLVEFRHIDKQCLAAQHYWLGWPGATCFNENINRTNLDWSSNPA